jgi:hypothetical protein
MGRRVKTRDEQLRDLRTRLDAEIDQILHERPDEALQTAGTRGELLARVASDEMPIGMNGPKPSPELARRLRRAAMYALLAASEIDARTARAKKGRA